MILPQISHVVVSLHGSGAEELQEAKSAVKEASMKGLWVLLNNIHTSPELLTELPAFLGTTTNGELEAVVILSW